MGWGVSVKWALSTASLGWLYGKRHPLTLGAPDVGRFLSHLAVEGKEVLDRPLPWLDDLTRAKQPERMPVTLTMTIQLFTHASPSLRSPQPAVTIPRLMSLCKVECGKSTGRVTKPCFTGALQGDSRAVTPEKC